MNIQDYIHRTKNPTLRSAFETLFQNRSGYIENVLSHPQLHCDIALYYGKTGEKGYGLAHIAEKHPEILPDLDEIILHSTIKEVLKDRIILETDNHKAVVDLVFNTKKHTWLVTAYEKLPKKTSPHL